jgi:phosphoribosyl-AMP cyclohydrolase
MNTSVSGRFAPPSKGEVLEKGTDFTPKFDAGGLIGAIVTDALSGEVLMFAYMNAEALAATIDNRVAHFWSRSRGKLWRKGEDSGNILSVEEIRVDCDQDVLWLKVRVAGEGVACHTGARSCFYRSVTLQPDAPSGLVFDAAQQKHHRKD